MVLRKLKRLLGLDSSSSSKRGAGRDVTVRDDRTEDQPTDDHDRGTGTHTAGETAETATGSDSPDETDEADGDDEAVSAETDAEASTESLVDEEAAAEDATAAAEPAEAAGPESEDVTTEIEEAEPDIPEAEAERDAQAEGDADGPDEDATPVDEVKGIGPAYSERLGEIGIHSADELADADPSELADRISVPEKTVRKWVDRASEK